MRCFPCCNCCIIEEKFLKDEKNKVKKYIFSEEAP